MKIKPSFLDNTKEYSHNFNENQDFLKLSKIHDWFCNVYRKYNDQRIKTTARMDDRWTIHKLLMTWFHSTSIVASFWANSLFRSPP